MPILGLIECTCCCGPNSTLGRPARPTARSTSTMVNSAPTSRPPLLFVTRTPLHPVHYYPASQVHCLFTLEMLLAPVRRFCYNVVRRFTSREEFMNLHLW